MRNPALGRVVLVVAIALIGAAALCLAHAEGGVPDLCVSLLGVTIGPLIAFLLALAGSFAPVRVAVYHVFPLDRPAPPPKTS
jgi:hypothetical protein